MANPPTPADSPPPGVPTRKRSRASSTASEEVPGSNKRAVSEVSSSGLEELSQTSARSPDSDHPNILERLSIHQDGISDVAVADDPMAPQEGMALDEENASPPIPPPEKLAIMATLKKKELVLGEYWYVVSRRWYRRWETACSGRDEKEGPVDESTITAVDNSDIADARGNIIVTPTEPINVEYLPQEAWEHLLEWYGPCERIVKRQIIAEGQQRELRFELFPPIFTIHRLIASEDNSLTGSSPPSINLSKKATIQALTGQIVAAYTRINTRFDPQEAVMNLRVYHVQQIASTDPPDIPKVLFPTGRLRRSKFKLVPCYTPEAITKTIEDCLMESGDLFVVEERPVGGEWLFNETPQASRAVTPLFGEASGQSFFSRLSASQKASSSTLKPEVKTSGYGITRSYSPSIRTPGTMGLANLGNTCFMNSAIQSLAHQPELTEYFLTGLFKKELNPDNPLGMHGMVAEAFGALLSRLWVQGPGSSSAYSPREFKQVLARFAPAFSGYQQHDAQELLAFLLDGLHEDLNRILKKPYVEKPEWKDGDEMALVELARKSWEGYMLRNDSVIVDLFQGQYKSTLVCPDCKKVSYTFDPFMYLTLPLPIKKQFRHDIFYVPWDDADAHVVIPVELPQSASLKDLRQLLGKWRNKNPENLLILEVFAGKFYKDMNDTCSVQDIGSGDNIVCFELPVSAQQSRGFKPGPNDPLIIPVFHANPRGVGGSRGYSSYSHSLFGKPFVIIVTPEDAMSEESLYALVIDRLVRWTERKMELFTWESSDGANSESLVDHIVPSQGGPVDSVTEIRESGEIVTMEEGDITEMSMDHFEMVEPAPLTRLGPKPNVFKLTLHAPTYNVTRTCDKHDPLVGPVSWESRKNQADGPIPNGIVPYGDEPPTPPHTPALIKSGEWLVCEWDVHMQNFYFGQENTEFRHLWNQFERWVHPDLEAADKERASKKKTTLTLEDCLDEFTREEQLGEEDLWYCPVCKKHVQATKKFDIWKVPDVLVVHLKRFSSSRILRDKIDALVDFPLEGLDLDARAMERTLARKLKEEGKDIGVEDLDDPLVYDLFAVTEHMGGLGGGHYRAFAKNHVDSNWYHFDDSFVTKTDARNAVNPNAYLLFYRRRTTKPLGGKTHERVQEAKANAELNPAESSRQLLTPPPESPPPAAPLKATDLPFSHHDEGGDDFYGPPNPYFNDDQLDLLADKRGSPSSVQVSDGSGAGSPRIDIDPTPAAISPFRLHHFDNDTTLPPAYDLRLGQTESHGDPNDIDL